MNDRFKFRFYDKQCKMYLPDGYYINGNKWMDDYYEDVYDLPENIIPEQCTGLKDKNGNLIYEGDVVKDEFGRKFKVIWSEEDCMFDGRIIYYDPEFGTRFDLYQGATDNSEIIGNIHEQAKQKD